jgi:outer membrane autotransporter protein
VTTGSASIAIFAQSVGGGGGLGGDVGLGIGFAGSVGGDGNGGDVDIDHTGNITTYGDGAHGIFAQSAGGTLSGGAVSVTLAGNIITEGADSNGIFAQSVGNSGGQDISIDIQSGSITGGSGTGAGIYMDGGNNNTLTNRGSISALSGTAIVGGTGNETIDNYGIITGSVDLGAVRNAFNNKVGGTFNAGATVNLEGGLLSNAGTFAPGGSGTVLTTELTGNLLQQESGIYDVDLDLTAYQPDLLNVSGDSNLAGLANINLVNTGWAKPGTQQATMLYSADDVTDSGLALLTQPSPIIDYELLLPNSTDVDIQTTIDFAPRGKGLNANQRAIGNAVNKIQLAGGSASFAPFAAALFRMPDMQSLGSAYDQMSPDTYDIYTKITSVITQQYTQTLLKRIHSIRSPLRLAGSAPQHADRDQILLAYSGSDASIGQLIGTGELTPEKATYSVWLDGFGKMGDQDEADGFNGYQYNVYGATLGLDRTFGTRFVAGIGIGYSYTDVDLDGARGNGDIDTIFGALYGSYFTRRMYVDAALSYGRQGYDNERNIVIGPLLSTVSSDHSGDTYSAFAEGGYNVDIKNWIIQPFVSLHYIYLDEESFSESGAGGLRVGSRQTDSLVSELGARITRVFRIKNSSLIPEISAAWNYDFDVDDRMITASFAGAPGTSFSVQGQDVEQHGATVGAGLTFISKVGLSASLKYHGEFRGNYQAHGFLVGLRYEF